jgi:hypothetical protein
VELAWSTRCGWTDRDVQLGNFIVAARVFDHGRAHIEHAITRAPRKLNAVARLFNAAVKMDAAAIGLRRYQKWQAKRSCVTSIMLLY